jgi:hypothetical protein
MSETLFLEFCAGTRGAGGAMMSIGNVEERNLAKGVNKTHWIGHAPDGMLNAINGGEIENGVRHRRFHHHGVDVAIRPVS